MNWKLWAGIAILLSPFVAMGVHTVRQDGWRLFFEVFGIVLGILLLCLTGTLLVVTSLIK